MSGSYVNTRGGRRRPQGADVAERGRRPSTRRRQHGHRPLSVLSQVYDTTEEGQSACLRKVSVSPVLWLLCQMVLVLLFALCCAFLLSSSASSQTSFLSRPGYRAKVWLRLEFIGNELEIRRNKNPVLPYYTTGMPFGRLICSAAGSDSIASHCNDMKKYFRLSDSNVTTITILHEAVYRINAAITFSSVEVRPVDVSVVIDNNPWITCQEGASTNGKYTHCTLFGIRYLARDAVISFNCSTRGQRIAAHGASTFFEIEMR